MLRKLLPLAAVVAASAGCASSARYVDRTPDRGVVAVPDYRHRGEAVHLIKEHVGTRYEIIDEREEPTGKTVTSTTEQKRDSSVATRFFALFTAGGETAKTTTTTGPATEYRIYYQKAGLPPVPPPAGPGGVVQTQYVSPAAPPADPPAGPTSLRPKLSVFDTGRDCKA